MGLPKDGKMCEAEGCRKNAAKQERYCHYHRRQLLKRMAADGYLTEVPKDVAPEHDTGALKRPKNVHDRMEMKW